MADPSNKHFTWQNFFVSFEVIVVNLVFGYVILFYTIWLAAQWPEHLVFVGITFYVWSLFLELIHVATMLYYSRDRKHHLALCMVFPLVPLYQLYLIANRIVSYTREMLWRTSFRDNFVPKHVRDVTWKW